MYVYMGVCVRVRVRACMYVCICVRGYAVGVCMYVTNADMYIYNM
jgi:hypothetical protein